MGLFFRKYVLVAISMSTNCQKLYSERRSNPVTDGKEVCCAKKPFKSHLTCGKFRKGYVNWPSTVYDPHPSPFPHPPLPPPTNIDFKTLRSTTINNKQKFTIILHHAKLLIYGLPLFLRCNLSNGAGDLVLHFQLLFKTGRRVICHVSIQPEIMLLLKFFPLVQKSKIWCNT